jgi:hypothetical protein
MDPQQLPRQAGAQTSGRDECASGQPRKRARGLILQRRRRGFTPPARADGFDNVDGDPNRGDIANRAGAGKGSIAQQQHVQDLLQTALRMFDHIF